MSLITNLTTIFGLTFGNIEGGPGAELRDMSDALARAINDHIAQPTANKAFIATGFGTTWNNAYTVGGLPTDVLRSHGTYIEPLIAPILADALALHLNFVALLMNAAAPPIAQASVSVVSAVLGSVPGGAAIATTMVSAVAAAMAVPGGGGLPTIPALVGTAITGLAGLVTSLRLTPALGADMANLLDFQLQSVGLTGATNARSASWAAIFATVLTIPVNPSLAGPLGVNFWLAILLTIQQAVPGIRAT